MPSSSNSGAGAGKQRGDRLDERLQGAGERVHGDGRQDRALERLQGALDGLGCGCAGALRRLDRGCGGALHGFGAALDDRLGDAPHRLRDAPHRLRDAPHRLRDAPHRLDGGALHRLRPRVRRRAPPSA